MEIEAIKKKYYCGQVVVENLAENEVVVGGYQIKKQAEQYHKRHICTNTAELPNVRRLANRVQREARKQPETIFYITRIGNQVGNYSQEDVADVLWELALEDNIKIDHNYMTILAKRVNDDLSFRKKYSEEKLKLWEVIIRDIRLQEANEKYGDYFCIFSSEQKIDEFLRLMADTENRLNNHAENLNIQRGVVEQIQQRLTELKIVPQLQKNGMPSLSEFGKYLYNRENEVRMPQYIRNFLYAIIGVVNAGSHTNIENHTQNPNFVNYREEIGNGTLRHILPTISYMLLCVMEWTAKQMKR